METRCCSKCGEAKPAAEFYKHSGERHRKDRLHSSCKPCHRATVKRTRRLQTPDQWRRHNLMRYYGITVEQWEQANKAQDGKCAICGERKRLVVDHCHATEKVRGLLCNGCNRGLGYFSDSPEALENAAAYLRAARVEIGDVA